MATLRRIRLSEYFVRLDMSDFARIIKLVKLMLETLAAGVLSAISVAFIRSILARQYKRCMLRHIPGPSSTSFKYGNLQQLYAPDGAFYGSLSQYGGVTKVNGLFGVSLHLRAVWTSHH